VVFERSVLLQIALIQQSKVGIHDLSRIESADKEELYRLNMAFELGIDLGCRLFAEGEAKSKRLLVLEKERGRYQKALSRATCTIDDGRAKLPG
jgi:hypothetical protein